MRRVGVLCQLGAAQVTSTTLDAVVSVAKRGRQKHLYNCRPLRARISNSIFF